MENEWINDPQSPYWLLIIYALCEDAKQNNETKWEEYLSEMPVLKTMHQSISLYDIWNN